MDEALNACRDNQSQMAKVHSEKGRHPQQGGYGG
jgi:hypothetical protein